MGCDGSIPRIHDETVLSTVVPTKHYVIDLRSSWIEFWFQILISDRRVPCALQSSACAPKIKPAYRQAPLALSVDSSPAKSSAPASRQTGVRTTARPMASSPWPRTAGAAPVSPPEAAAAAAAATVAAATPAPTSEHNPVKEGGNAAAAAVLQQQEEAKTHLPRDHDSEAVIQEHEQKINRYQAILAARLKAKFFSKKAFDGANIFETETIFEGETIQSSRWPCTRSFANPEFLSRDKNSHEKGNSPSLAADSSAKNNSPPLAGEASPKNNASALSTENNLTPGKRQQSKKT
ncbi:hypothetical protein BS78_02G213700 [Paspalum vaginatum]|nr:hypothetical protein BS78_02G213700 [Paspalum vaginatum]